MKKLVSISLCGLALMTAGAQLANVDQAKKLAGKPDKIEEARSLIKEALANPETANSAVTYYTAGKVEWDAFDKNPDSDPVMLADELLNGYNYFLQVFPLDELPNEKGEVKPKYTKELQKKISEKQSKFWDYGAILFNEKMFPQAYEAFMIYGDMPDLEVLGKNKPETVDTLRAIAYFNAGLAAWSGNEVDKAAAAFRKARENNYTSPDAALYEIASWQNIQQTDTAREKESWNYIYDAAKGGFDKFGMEQPAFLNNMVNSMLNTGREAEALSIVNDAMGQYPDRATLYGLRAYLNERMNNDDASEADYRKAASMPDADYETLRNASVKLYHIGQAKWNGIELGDPDIVAKKSAIKADYFEPAKAIANKAKSLTDDSYQIDTLIENIDYMMELR